MATHDYVIDNSTGANVRADINNALAAIVSNNSSSSQPTTRYAYMWWADTTTGILKIRNSANDGWVELLQLDGTLTLEDGTNSAPALAFRDDLDTGIYSSNANTFNVATGGTERMELGSTTIFNEDGADVDFRIEGDTNANLFYLDAGNDRIGLGTASPAAILHVSDTYHFTAAGGNSTTGMMIGNYDGSSYGVLSLRASTHRFDISGSEKARFDSSGRLLIGTTTEGHANADDLTIATSGDTGISIRSGTSNAGNIYFSDGTSGNDEFRGFISYGHNVNNMYFATEATTRLQINDIGHIEITTEVASNGNVGLQLDTNSTSNASSLLFQAGGENRAQLQVQRVAGDGGYVALQVARTDNSNTLVNVFTATPSTSGDTTPDLTLNGNLVVSSGNGIDFSATGEGTGTANEAEILTDYEEGTVNITMNTHSDKTNVSGNGNTTLTVTGHYVKIGKTVNVTATYNGLHQSGSNARQAHVIFSFTGLPYASYNGTGASVQTTALGYNRGIYARYNQVRVDDDLSNFYVYMGSNSTAALTNVNQTDSTGSLFWALNDNDSSQYLTFKMTYLTAA